MDVTKAHDHADGIETAAKDRVKMTDRGDERHDAQFLSTRAETPSDSRAVAALTQEICFSTIGEGNSTSLKSFTTLGVDISGTPSSSTVNEEAKKSAETSATSRGSLHKFPAEFLTWELLHSFAQMTVIIN
ncbi:hypothetical protein HHI36_016140 [Cryptolaemus montrouzieri]|uniref:Uncharacterized protein n=1 Tax=Cryptolaemus montrouzieri TaxID=559131 RepID=A0ABD2NIM6_9CUCU